MDEHPASAESIEGVLYCSSCGAIAHRVHTATQSVRSLSLGKNVEQGDLLCERCLQELQEEFSEEELFRGPA